MRWIDRGVSASGRRVAAGSSRITSSTRAASSRCGPSSRQNVRAPRVMAAVVVATIAFWAYTTTLLPGVDLGDTGGFQAAVPWPAVSARQAYPLYYSLAKPFVAALGGAHPALALNLLSAVLGATAVGILVLVVTRASGSRLPPPRGG